MQRNSQTSKRNNKTTQKSSTRKPHIGFRKLIDKLEQAEITMELEEAEKLKLK